MKKLLSLAALALMMCVAACQNGGYKVTGTATGAEDGDTVILAEVRGMFDVDTLQTVLVKNGQFVFTGTQDSAAMRYVIWKSNANPDLSIATRIALENADITPSIDTNRFNLNALTPEIGEALAEVPVNGEHVPEVFAAKFDDTAGKAVNLFHFKGTFAERGENRTP